MQVHNREGILTWARFSADNSDTAAGNSVLQAVSQAAQKTESDTLELSTQAQEYLNRSTENASSEEAPETPEQGTADEAAQADASLDTDSLREQVEAANEQAKAEAEEMEIRLKCLKITANLISGKKVPGQDTQFLCEHDPEMFSKAITLRAVSAGNGEKAKRVTDDDDFAGEDAAGENMENFSEDEASSVPSAAASEASLAAQMLQSLNL